MKPIEWNSLKNELLKSERGVCFEDVLNAINENRIYTDVTHPNKNKWAHQKMFIIEINNYVYLVPYVEDDKKVFLKTIIPSRKATKKYLKKGEK